MQRATAAWERTVPKQTLRWGANVLFRHPPHIPSAERMALTPDPAPALRAALTPGPSPALWERGELVSGLGIVARRWGRIATATLTSPLPLSWWERKGAGGRYGPPSPPAPLPHCGRGVVVDSVSLQDAGAGSLRLRSPPCSSALLVGTERGRGKVRAALTPDPAPALRAALTPGPSPALRERGELVSGLGIVARR